MLTQLRACHDVVIKLSPLPPKTSYSHAASNDMAAILILHRPSVIFACEPWLTQAEAAAMAMGADDILNARPQALESREMRRPNRLGTNL